jgi:hypothetical protein
MPRLLKRLLLSLLSKKLLLPRLPPKLRLIESLPYLPLPRKPRLLLIKLPSKLKLRDWLRRKLLVDLPLKLRLPDSPLRLRLLDLLLSKRLPITSSRTTLLKDQSHIHVELPSINLRALNQVFPPSNGLQKHKHHPELSTTTSPSQPLQTPFSGPKPVYKDHQETNGFNTESTQLHG